MWLMKTLLTSVCINQRGAGQGKPTQNAFIERFNRTYRTEILDFYLFRTLNEARKITERWLKEYNNERPHESLNNLAPEECRLMAETADISKSA